MLQVRTSPELPLRQTILTVFIIALIAFIFINLLRGVAKEIIINNDGEHLVIKTSARTVRQVLNYVDIAVGTNDLVAPSMDTVVKNGAYEDNKPVKSDTLTDEEFKTPQAQVVAYGTRSRPAAVARYGTSRPARAIKVIATAYTHTGNRTATGVYPKVGTVAVDPAVIPLGSKMFVEGYGEGVAQDTGGVIKGDRIDVFFDNYEEAIGWGKKTVNIYIY